MLLNRFRNGTVKVGKMVNQGAGKDVDSDQAKPLGVCEATEQVAQGGDLGGGERSALTSRQRLVGRHHLVLLDVPLHQLHGRGLGHLHAAAQDGDPLRCCPRAHQSSRDWLQPLQGGGWPATSASP